MTGGPRSRFASLFSDASGHGQEDGPQRRNDPFRSRNSVFHQPAPPGHWMSPSNLGLADTAAALSLRHEAW
jgi:hypothetical protein